MEDNNLAVLGDSTISEIAIILARTLGRITEAHVQPPTARSLTARSYASSYAAYMAWARANNEGLPTRAALERWRDAMKRDTSSGRKGGKLSTETINSRLKAMRKLLVSAADEIMNRDIKELMRDWAKIANTKAIIEQDQIEEDFGRRLTQDEIKNLFEAIGTGNIRALRDRAVAALGLGAGLRVSEVVKLTVKDVFHTRSGGISGIRVRDSKGGKSRIVVMGSDDNWVLQYVRDYCEVIGLDNRYPSDAKIIRGVRKARAATYSSVGESLSTRQAQAAISDYEIMVAGQRTAVSSHDLRRTYAKLCKANGMEWEALRAQLGHSSVAQTERYVGKDVNWHDRQLNWSV